MRWPFGRKGSPRSTGNRSIEDDPARRSRNAPFRVIGPESLERFLEKGFHKRHFFPHSVRYVPRPGSDGQWLAEHMYGIQEPSALRQVVLHAHGDAFDGIPSELFFDDDVVWHRQHLGLPGHVAAANLIVSGDELLTTARFSDVVQRISRRRDLATLVEKRFRGWDHMLLNAIFGYAVERDLCRIHFPTAQAALANTDPARSSKREMFERIYDDNIERRFRAERRQDRWVVDVSANRDRWVPLSRAHETIGSTKTICICHDTERGLGHLTADPAHARLAADVSDGNLERVLDAETRYSVHGTYAVVGCLMPDLRAMIEKEGHEIAFHSYNHNLAEEQLERCRRLDYRIPGYRPPNSRITAELNDLELTRRNFEWLASSPGSIDAQYPQVRAGFARIPVLFDDFSFYKHGGSWAAWEAEALSVIEHRPTTTFGIHDCYAHYWIKNYDGFLSKLTEVGRLRTIGEVADELFRCDAE